MIDGEQICSFSTPPDLKMTRTPSASFVTVVMGSSGVHWAAAGETDANRVSAQSAKAIRIAGPQKNNENITDRRMNNGERKQRGLPPALHSWPQICHGSEL